MTTDEQVSALRQTAAMMRAGAEPVTLYRVVAHVAGKRRYVCIDTFSLVLELTPDAEQAAVMTIERALRVLRQVRRRMAPGADMEALP